VEGIIVVEDLKKSYGPVQAVKGISFCVEPGELFAFVGPNGAGKSTTIDILCTILRPDAGSVAIDGHALGKDDEAIRRSIGVVFQQNLLDPLLTVKENMTTRGRFYTKSGAELEKAVAWAARAAGVEEFVNRRYGKLSGGQRRRADIARALVNTPRVLFLDEPTTGLDPQTRQNVWESIRSLRQETGMTVFFSTHYMEEAAAADDVVVIDDGRIAEHGTPTALREKYASDLLKLFAPEPAALLAELDAMGAAYRQVSDQVVVKLGATLEALPILDRVRPHIQGFEVFSGTMDDAFIGITGKEIRQ